MQAGVNMHIVALISALQSMLAEPQGARPHVFVHELCLLIRNMHLSKLPTNEATTHIFRHVNWDQQGAAGHGVRGPIVGAAPGKAAADTSTAGGVDTGSATAEQESRRFASLAMLCLTTLQEELGPANRGHSNSFNISHHGLALVLEQLLSCGKLQERQMRWADGHIEERTVYVG